MWIPKVIYPPCAGNYQVLVQWSETEERVFVDYFDGVEWSWQGYRQLINKWWDKYGV